MIELAEPMGNVNDRLKGVKKKDLKRGRTIESSLGRELIIKKEDVVTSIEGDVKLETLMPFTLGQKQGIIKTEYNMLAKIDGEWTSSDVIMEGYFVEDGDKFKRYREMYESWEKKNE